MVALLALEVANPFKNYFGYALKILWLCYLVLEKKILTSDNFVRSRGFGQICCPLCNESMDHLQGIPERIEWMDGWTLENLAY